MSIQTSGCGSADGDGSLKTGASVDAALVRLTIQRGERDERPFTELFRRHRDYVWHLALRWLGNAADAEDVTQEVFVTVYRKLASFEGRSSFRTWLHRIAVNRCKNALRSRASREHVILPEAPDWTPAATQASSDPSRFEGRDLLGKAMRLLRPPEREVLRLVELEERSYSDSARALGISLGATKMRLLRAREALRRILDRIGSTRR